MGKQHMSNHSEESSAHMTQNTNKRNMKLSATTMEVSLCLLLLISVQTIAEPSTDKTGKIQPPPVPSSPTQNPPPSPPTNNENTMFMPETISQMRSLRYLPLN
ncbi:hypothetical protein YC2023_103973 [Brassica napus]